MSEVLKETKFDFLGMKMPGKVRDRYVQKDRLVLVATDRHSSFDRIIAHIPHKGQVLNQAAAWWFEKTKDIIANHVLAVPDQNAMVAKKCELVKIEAVVRGYLTGVTETSIWTRYSAGQRGFGDITLPNGMKKNQKLPHPIFDPTTKEEHHDRSINREQLIAEGFVSADLFDKIKTISLKLFTRGQELAAARGLILVDTKYEFGLDEKGELLLIDEIHTPDSSRWWKLDTYEMRVSGGHEPEYFDKEFLRLWFKEHSDPYKDEKLPEAPEHLVDELSRRYIEMYEMITSEKFIPGGEPMIPRIENNLRPFAA